MDKISIVTICHNCKADLEMTMQSVFSQDYRYKEYIIVDGGSTDGTKELLKHHEDQIDLIISEQDDGIYDALNKGISRASGEWIICLNAGDIFSSDHILSDILHDGIPQDKSFIYSDLIMYHDDGSKKLHKMDRAKGDIHHQNAIYRKNLHEQYGYYIVTHPYIVSDLIFFLSIPEEKYLKTDGPIAYVKYGGTSSNIWCAEQSWAAKVIFGYDTIPLIFLRDIRMRFGLWRRKIIRHFLSATYF